MITIELTDEKLEHLIEGAAEYGRCSLLAESTEGDDVAIVVSNGARRSRRARAQRAAAHAGEAGENRANHEPADGVAQGAPK
jgi:hypothetical protein